MWFLNLLLIHGSTFSAIFMCGVFGPHLFPEFLFLFTKQSNIGIDLPIQTLINT